MERRVVNPWSWSDKHEFVQAVQLTAPTRMLVCSGQASMSADGRALHAGDMRAQINQALDNLEVVLREAGFTLADVVRLNYFTTDMDAFFAGNADLKRRLAEAGCRCVSSMYGVTRLGTPELLVEIEALAVA
jgi:enamine deaminase RidA (YjgF/YER057c/UK114 family)